MFLRGAVSAANIRKENDMSAICSLKLRIAGDDDAIEAFNETIIDNEDYPSFWAIYDMGVVDSGDGWEEIQGECKHYFAYGFSIGRGKGEYFRELGLSAEAYAICEENEISEHWLIDSDNEEYESRFYTYLTWDKGKFATFDEYVEATSYIDYIKDTCGLTVTEDMFTPVGGYMGAEIGSFDETWHI